MKKIEEFLIFSILFFTFNLTYSGEEFQKGDKDVYDTNSTEKVTEPDKDLIKDCFSKLNKAKGLIDQYEEGRSESIETIVKNLKEINLSLYENLKILEESDHYNFNQIEIKTLKELYFKLDFTLINLENFESLLIKLKNIKI